jgi:hypothetical protein
MEKEFQIMRRVLFILAIALVLLMASVAVASAHGNGNSPAQLTHAGWTCMDIPPLSVHCFRPGTDFANPAPAIAVKVFDTHDPTATEAPFLGTELLLRADIYAHGEPPCPQAEDGHYDDLSGEGLPYFACHHYSH